MRMTDLSVFRIYEPQELGRDGYPLAWHDLGEGVGVKHLVREQAEHRCVRCRHPYLAGEGGRNGWSQCDEQCDHVGPTRCSVYGPIEVTPAHRAACLGRHDARWRILTVHHLDGWKANLRWWNLVALCQRCHLQIQGKVQLARVWPWEHSEWFKPYAAGWYAYAYHGENLTYEQTEAQMDELLALERAA